MMAGVTGDAVEVFRTERHRLFGLAYRLLGSASDAEDVLQSAFEKWVAADGEVVSAPAAWLTTVVTNLCLRELGSTRRKRERYAGTWLPEPLVTSGGALGPLETAEQRESVSFALLVLMERLTAAERAVQLCRGHEGVGGGSERTAGGAGLARGRLARRARAGGRRDRDHGAADRDEPRQAGVRRAADGRHENPAWMIKEVCRQEQAATCRWSSSARAWPGSPPERRRHARVPA
jgi:DNA-directed RNA polymerase specialized sigma24 family protein